MWTVQNIQEKLTLKQSLVNNLGTKVKKPQLGLLPFTFSLETQDFSTLISEQLY